MRRMMRLCHRSRFDTSLRTLALGQLFESPQSHFRLLRLQNTTAALQQSGNTLCLAILSLAFIISSALITDLFVGA